MKRINIKIERLRIFFEEKRREYVITLFLFPFELMERKIRKKIRNISEFKEEDNDSHICFFYLF